MALLSTFSTNGINILAGINGSEVSQAIIIAISVIINDLLYLPWPIDWRIPLHLLGNQAEVSSEIRIGGVWSAGMAHGSRLLMERHLFSLYFMLPLLGVCTGFLYHNWYDSTGLRLCIFEADIALCVKVSRQSFPRGYPLLPHRDGFRRRRHPSSFFQDSAPFLPSADFQLPFIMSSTFWTGRVSSTSRSQV